MQSGGDALADMLCILSSIVLVDGDSFDLHNGVRQAGIVGRKLDTQMRVIRNQAAFNVWLKNTKLMGYNNFIKPSNIGKIIKPADVEQGGYLYNFPVILLCVDNHKTRYEVSKWAELLDDVLVLNGGNSKTSGNITVYERRHGQALDPAIYDIYPEIAAGNDKRPDEVSCTDVAPENDQTAIVNSIVASVMLGRLTAWWRKGLDEKTPRKDANGQNIKVRRNEVVFDLSRCVMQPLTRNIERKEND